MSPRLAGAWAGSVALAALAGWAARDVDLDFGPGGERVVLRAPAAPPLVRVQADGLVTLRVEQRPLGWVLAQIARQTGGDVWAARPPAGPASLPVPRRETVAALAEPAEAADPIDAVPTCPSMPDPDRLLQAVEQGDPDERADALLRARADGLRLPEPMLRGLVEGAGPERLRVAALEAWLDQRGQGDAKTERALLESVAHLSGAEVQQYLRQRLDDLDEAERLDALSAQGHSP